MAKTCGRIMKEFYIINIDIVQLLRSEICVQIVECFSVHRSLFILRTIQIRIHCVENNIIIIIIIIFLHGLDHMTCSGINALPSFPGASAIPSSPGFVGEGVCRESGVVHSFEVVDPFLFVFESHVLYSRDL